MTVGGSALFGRFAVQSSSASTAASRATVPRPLPSQPAMKPFRPQRLAVQAFQAAVERPSPPDPRRPAPAASPACPPRGRCAAARSPPRPRAWASGCAASGRARGRARHRGSARPGRRRCPPSAASSRSGSSEPTMLTAVLSPRPHGRPIAPQVSRKGPRRLSSRRLLRPSPASQAVGSSRHSSTPCRRLATAFSSAGNAASETTTGAPPSRASTRSTVPSGRRSHSSAGVLPQDGPPTSACHRITRLAPRLGDARRHALAAQAGDGRQQGLRDVILRRARPVRGVLHPLPPLAGEDLQREGGQLGTALLQQAGIDRGPGRRRGHGRPPGVALRPVVAEDGRSGW